MPIRAPKRQMPNYSYDTLTLDLSVARDGHLKSFAGNYIKAVESSDIDANVEIRLNDSTRDLITLHKGRAINGKFFDIYFTNTAQAGKTITLVIADLTAITIEDDGVVGDIDTIQSIVNTPVPTMQDIFEQLFNDGRNPSFELIRAITTVTLGNSYVLGTVPSDKVWIPYGGIIIPSAVIGNDMACDIAIYNTSAFISVLASHYQKSSDANYINQGFSDFFPIIGFEIAETFTIELDCRLGSADPIRSIINYIEADA